MIIVVENAETIHEQKIVQKQEEKKMQYALSYREKKAKIREEAIRWQYGFIKHSYSMSEVCEKQAYFEKMGKRYGLIQEFRENGII